MKRGALALLLLALLPSLWLAGITLTRATLFLGYPYALDREEGFVALQGLALAEGATIYPDIHAGPPWLVGNYPPLHPLLASVAVRAGVDPLAAGRGVALLGIVLLAGGLAWAGYQTGGPIAAVAAPLLCLATWDAMSWAPYARVDFLALGLGALALAAGLDRGPRWRLVSCAGCVVLAFMAKQTALVVPAALVLAGLLAKDERREAARLAVLLLVAGAGAFLLLILVTKGQAWHHLVTYNRNVLEPSQLLVWLRHLVRFHAGMVVAALVAAVLAWRWSLLTPGHSRILLSYAALSVPTLLATAKAGAAENYLLEFHAAIALLIAAVAGRAVTQQPGGALALAAILLLGHVAPTPSWHRPRMMTRELWPHAAIEEAHAAAVLRLRALPEGPVLSEDPILAYRAGRATDFQPFIMSQLAREERWDETPFVHDIAITRYRAIVTTQNLEEEGFLWGFTPAMRRAIVEHYTLTAVIAVTPRERRYLYEPRP